ncbi:hypothetical protein A9Q99_04635 [Gammaproteobacteria bacterium 45_16_T64]|nr:hypothetical protein A9Q99_04635 [Gammaproteobacteria bacterium 45_16_T64]
MLEHDKELHKTIEKIYSSVPGCLPGEHWQSMFAIVDQFIPIRGAWMGHSEWWLHEDYREGYQEFYKMPDDFAASYFSMSTEDEGNSGDPLVIKALMASDNNTLRLSEVLPDRDIRMSTDAYLQWGKHYAIGDAIMFHDEFSGTKASVFIAFYRREIENDFNSHEHQQLLILKQHMMAAHRLLLQDISRRFDADKTEGYLMLVDALGLVYHMEDTIEKWLRSMDLSFTGKHLPQGLLDAITQRLTSWRHLTISTEMIGTKGFLLVKLQKNAFSDTDSLTQMENKVADLLGQGCTIKQVANEMNIAVSTASSHSKKVYSKLGVSGKHALVELYRNL